MADNKKYYYMRLKENFFDSPELKTIESMRGGYKYSNILLKLYLLSLRDGGRLTFKQDLPYDTNMLSKLTGFSKIEIENALKIFKKFKLIEVLDTGTIYMMDIQTLIGKSSNEADRQREYQAKIASEKQSIMCKKSNKESNEISTPEIEIEIEKEIDIEIEKERELETGQAPARSYGRYNNVFLSDTELDELKAELPDKWEYYIDRLSTHIASKGAKYRSHAATIYKWAQEDEAKKPPKKGIPDYTFKEGESL